VCPYYKIIYRPIMKKLFIILIIFIPYLIFAQQYNPDSQRRALKTETSDSVLFKINFNLEYYYEEVNVDSALYFVDQSLKIARKANQKLAEGAALTAKAYTLNNISKYGESLKCLADAFKILENPESEKLSTWLTAYSGSQYNSPHNYRLQILSITHHIYALLMDATLNYKEEIFHFNEEKRISEMCGRNVGVQLAYMNLSRIYTTLNKLDTALTYAKNTLSLSEKNKFTVYIGWAYGFMGNIYYKMKKYDLARKSYIAGINNSIAEKDRYSLEYNYLQFTSFFLDKKDRDSSLYYAKKALSVTRELGTAESLNYYLAIAYDNLYQAYKLNNKPDSAYKYLQLAMDAKNVDYKNQIENLAHFQSITLSHEQQLQELEKEKIETQNKTRLYVLIAVLIVFIIIALLLHRNNRNKKKANQLLQSQKEEIEVQKKNVEKTLSELKSTQAQLIHSEKMASLGEMTAGIAHEIKNPLNFINNFSEVSNELISEMKEELQNGSKEEAISIADDLKQNLEKINHHGKRADSIVKGMLLHSRGTAGEKTPTDINDLLEQYVTLAYHGMRAQNKDFNITIERDYDKSLDKINVVPQDISRVFLNIINNGCYAANDKKKKDGEGFSPTIKVSTKKLKDIVEIRIADNGNGVPDKIKDKLFQPFFTTKPTGEGTGLGLSLSYDIVVKQHGGKIKIESNEGEGAEFIITLPYL
jgi:two-component system NtrC family sensor kinase